MYICSFRLILNSFCDESKYIHDANKEIEWEDVASVEWCVEKEDCCSLCLMPHTAPRVLSCGHCFCFACIQQYLALQSDAWIKCPICSVLVEKSSLRPVRFIHNNSEIKVGSVLSMNLVVRSPDSINAFSADHPYLPYYLKNPIPPADAAEEDTQYCHLLFNTPYYELTLLQENLNALDTCEREMNLIGEVYLLKSMRFARESICSRIQVLHAGYGDTILPTELGSLPYPPSPSFLDSVLFYYTLPWRLSYHLLPLSFQCIRNSFGFYHQCPGTIRAKVLEIEDVELSSRECSLDKTLQHLPMQTIIHYIELDVRMIVHERIDKKLWDQIKKREMNRKQENRQKMLEERRMSVGLHYIFNLQRKIKREEIQYFEEYAPYMLGEEEEQPNMTDCQAFPTLQGKATPAAVKVKSIWSDSHSVIGINVWFCSLCDIVIP